MTLEIRNLWVSSSGKQILKGVNLVVRKGEIHALMGPNGSGKSTLSLALMGHPKYVIDRGEVLLDGKNILAMKSDERAKMGLFLAFQHPLEINGLELSQFMLSALRARGKISVVDFHRELEKNAEALGLDKSFLSRSLNVGFSGGEKKRAEVLQLAMMKPQIAILDETDSGLDIDSLRIVANAVNHMRSPEFGALVITHYQRLLDYIEPDVVHVFADGRIVATGSGTLAKELEKKGYEPFVKKPFRVLE